MSEKKTEPWILLSVRVSPEGVEATCAYLLDASPTGIEQVDLTHPAPPPDLRGDRVEIRAFFPPGTDADAQEEELTSFLARVEKHVPDFAFDPPRSTRLGPEEWADGWKKHFHPVQVGRFFIHPGWVPPDTQSDYPVRIDPSLAFGTGLHPTTQLCLAEMDRLLPVQSFLDVGTGSGILALAAARCGVPEVFAVDNDPQACQVARENMSKNGLQGRITLIEGEVTRVSQRFDLVVANILSGTLIGMAPALSARLNPSGTLLLSGILIDEEAEAIEAYRACGCHHAITRQNGEWSLIGMNP